MSLHTLHPTPRPALRPGPISARNATRVGPGAARVVALGALLGAPAAAHAQPNPPAPEGQPTSAVVTITAAPPQPQQVVTVPAAPAQQPPAQVVIVQQPAPQPTRPAVVYAVPARPYVYGPPPAGYAQFRYAPAGYAPAGYVPAGYAPPPARREPLRGTIGMNLGFVVLNSDSAFNRSAALWGYEGFHSAGQLALDGGGHVTPWLMLGARAGFGWAGAGHAGADQASLTYQTVDASALVRVGYPAPVARNFWIFAGVQGTGGAIYAWSTLRGESRTAWLPRASAELVFLAMGARLGVSVRVGYQFANWSGLGSAGEGQPLGGVTVSTGLEVRL